MSHPDEALLPELLNLIRGLVRATRDTRARCRLRLVSHSWRTEDVAFVSPSWTSEHADLTELELPALRLFDQFCSEMAGLNWPSQKEPESIKWVGFGYPHMAGHRVRLKWAIDADWKGKAEVLSVFREADVWPAYHKDIRDIGYYAGHELQPPDDRSSSETWAHASSLMAIIDFTMLWPDPSVLPT